MTSQAFTLAFLGCRLRTRLDFDTNSDDDVELTSEAAKRVALLEEKLVDAEASERDFRRKLDAAQARETTLVCRVEDLQRSADVTSDTLRSADIDSERYWKLLEAVQSLEKSESKLKSKVDELQTEDTVAMKEVKPCKTHRFSVALTMFFHRSLQRIAELERSERALTVQLELVTSQPEGETTTSASDAERLERHLREQIAELERDREELHVTSRADRNTIHELRMRCDALQLSEDSLKQQLDRYEKLSTLCDILHSLPAFC